VLIVLVIFVFPYAHIVTHIFVPKNLPLLAGTLVYDESSV